MVYLTCLTQIAIQCTQIAIWCSHNTAGTTEDQSHANMLFIVGPSIHMGRVWAQDVKPTVTDFGRHRGWGGDNRFIGRAKPGK